MMNWQIRRSRSDDIDELRRIYLEVRTSAFSWINTSTFALNDFDTNTEGEPVLVAVLDNKVVGFVSWWPPDHFIHNLYVDPGYVSIGIGKALLRACLSEIGRPATLKCLQKNTNALRFYQSQGWSIKSAANATEGDYFLLSFTD